VKDLLSFLTAQSKTSSHTCIKRALRVIFQASVVNSTMTSTHIRIVDVRVFVLRIPNLISGFRREVDENCVLLGCDPETTESTLQIKILQSEKYIQ
jgi:hypothetical protein